jgi:hypothetical protein
VNDRLQTQSLFEKCRPQILAHMDERSDQHVIGLLRVEDVVRLEAEAAIAGNKLVGAASDAWKSARRPNVRSKPAW